MAQVLVGDAPYLADGQARRAGRQEHQGVAATHGDAHAEQRVHPVVDRVFPFEEVVAAFRHLEAGTQVGKAVIRIP
ncbi:zinc-binding dehydrogenase [Corallococcus sp. M34]|nr:zinc-binding dehydrogenase [Citreicoccus inhibens]